MESCLNEWSHDAAHAGLISAAVALAVMLHAKPGVVKKSFIGEEEREIREHTDQKKNTGSQPS